MTAPNCQLPAPDFYTTMMHGFHFVSYPVYLVTLFTLFREHSKHFQIYKYYIISHVIINVVSETYVSFAMLPMTYLPYVMFRTTGWLAQYGFSGLTQFYLLSFLVSITMGSIIEMLYFRFKVCIIDHETHKSFKLLRVLVNIYRFMEVFPYVIEIIGYKNSISGQQQKLKDIYNQNPLLPAEFTCYSCVIALMTDWVTWVTFTCFGIQLVTSLTLFTTCLLSIWKFVWDPANSFSKETIKLQVMLLISLFTQVTIHTTLIGMPVIFLGYAVFFDMNNDCK